MTQLALTAPGRLGPSLRNPRAPAPGSAPDRAGERPRLRGPEPPSPSCWEGLARTPDLVALDVCSLLRKGRPASHRRDGAFERQLGPHGPDDLPQPNQGAELTARPCVGPCDVVLLPSERTNSPWGPGGCGSQSRGAGRSQVPAPDPNSLPVGPGPPGLNGPFKRVRRVLTPGKRRPREAEKRGTQESSTQSARGHLVARWVTEVGEKAPCPGRCGGWRPCPCPWVLPPSALGNLDFSLELLSFPRVVAARRPSHCQVASHGLLCVTRSA